MNNKFESFFILGFILFILFFFFLLIKKTLFIKLAFNHIINNKILSFLILLIILIPSLFISSAFIVNDSLTNSYSNYINSKVGLSKGMIFSKNEGNIWNQEKTNSIASISKSFFDENLAILYSKSEISKVDSLNKLDSVVVLNFNSNNAQIYNPKIIQEEIDLRINENEAVISSSIAKDLGIKVNDKIKIKDKKFEVKNIVEDNGLIGFNAPVKSSYLISGGSVFLSNKNVAELFFKDNVKDKEIEGQIYNGLLLSSGTTNYDVSNISLSIQEKLNFLDSSLVFNEFSQSLYVDLNSWSNNTNFGQMILLLSILPLLLCLYLY